MMVLPDFNPEDYLSDADLGMEQQIDQYLQRTKSGTISYSSSDFELNLVDVEYRKEELVNIKISSTTKVFDTDAGSSLNNYIEIFGTPVYQSFMFSYNKQLIGSIERGWSLEQYLAYRPIASAFLYLRFTSVPLEAPIETRFAIEMEMAGGEILRDTTETVTLLP
ncbi:MAG: hypothetical protein ACK5HT_13590 [Draconibacterium sp.]